MAQGLNLAADLDQALGQGTAFRKIQILRAITDLFLIAPEPMPDEQIALFDDVIGRIAEHMETEARAELAAKLAAVPHAPPGVINMLAADSEIAVAGSVLAQSPRLTEETLLAVARANGQDHLLAIAARRELSEMVTDVLVRRGDSEVVRFTASNHGARFSDNGFKALVIKSRRDQDLAMLVGARQDIPPQYFERLITEASAVTRAKLATSYPHLSDLIDSVVSQVARRMRDAVANKSDFSTAQHRIEDLKLRGPITPDHVRRFAELGMFEETAVALSELAQMPLATIEKALTDRDIDQVLIIMRALDLPWMTVSFVLRGARKDKMVGPDDLHAAQIHFENITLTTAQRILKFYRERVTAAGRGRASGDARLAAGIQL